MKTELYNKIFERMDELGAVRKDLTFGCNVILKSTGWTSKKAKVIMYFDKTWAWKFVGNWDVILTTNERNRRFKQSWEVSEIIGHPPVLSDCIKIASIWDYTKDIYDNDWVMVECNWWFEKWDCSKPYLLDQSDELWEKILSLIS